ncbi:MAG: redoxin domain-containing protein [Algicola sp.]|nr:redoxin domain-containing protein [Algicola sp.]
MTFTKTISHLAMFASIFTLTACTQEPQLTEAESEHELAGHLFGANGKPMTFGQIRIAPLLGKTPENTVVAEVGADGQFNIDFDTKQRYQLMFAGVGHLPSRLVVDYQGQKDLKIDVELDSLTYLAQPVNPAVMLFTGVVEGKEKAPSHNLVANDNGVFTATIDLPAGPIRYKLNGFVEGRHWVSNPQAAEFSLGRWGNFHSVIEHQGGDWTLNVKPIELRSKLAENPVTLSGDWAEQQQVISVLVQYNRVLQQQRAAKVKAKSADFEYQQGLSTLKQMREKYQQQPLKDVVLAMSTAISGQSEAIFEQAVSQIAPDSWVWSINRVSFASSLTASTPEDDSIERSLAVFNQIKKLKTHADGYLDNNGDDDGKAKLLLTLADNHRNNGDNAGYLEYYKNLKDNYSHVWYFEFYNQILEPTKLGKGVDAPAFKIAALEQPSVMFEKSTFGGKVYLLDFWATWCTPCLKELPVLHETFEAFKDKGFEILSLSADTAANEVTTFRQGKWKMPWKHAFLNDGEHPMVKDYFVFGYPAAFLIDENGKVLATGEKVRGDKLQKTLAEYYESQKG